MKEYRLSRLALINIAVLLFLLGAFVSPIVYSGLKNWFTEPQAVKAAPLSKSSQESALALQKAYINIYKKASPSVVYIRTNIVVRAGGFWRDFYQEKKQAGSGFIVDNKGFIVTNDHVVAGARKIEVIFHDNTKTKARLVGRDEASDVALIKVSASDRLIPADLGDSDKVQVGQLAFALGAPFGLDRTFTVGIISAKQRRVDNSRYSRIQTDASINVGNSGGPLLNVFGEVVGINQSIYSTTGGSVGIGFAIPINDAKNVIKQLRKEKRVIGKPSLGVHIGIPARTLREDLGLGRQAGVVVIQVLRGSSAQQAGLREYDFIYSVNGKAIKTNKDLVSAVQKAGVGGKLKLKIIRKGKKKSITAKVGERLSR